MKLFMSSSLRMCTGQLGKYKVLLGCMEFLFGVCSCKFSRAQPLQLHILNSCWNDVFVMCSTLTGTLHSLGAILNYSSDRRTS
jgi:hypothetical protein